MTTPRDAIAGLSERLQSQGSHTMTRGELIATYRLVVRLVTSGVPVIESKA